MKKIINGVEFSMNPNPHALYPICTRVETLDKWSVSEVFFNFEEAETYAKKAPFANRRDETKAFNVTRAETLIKRAARNKSIGQVYPAAKDALMAELYKTASETGEMVTDSQERAIRWMANDLSVEKAASVFENWRNKCW